jgi:hypothetical protein
MNWLFNNLSEWLDYFEATTDNLKPIQPVQEVLAGTVDGINQTFTMSLVPQDTASLAVFFNGVLVNRSDYTVLSNAITFGAGKQPQPGQVPEVFFFKQLLGGGGGGGANWEVEFRTVTAPEAVAKSLTLSQLPVNPAKVAVDVKNIGPQFYTDDYSIVGTTLSWNGLGMDALPIVAGDKIRIMYSY